MSATCGDILAKSLIYQEYGEPVKVLTICDQKLSKPTSNQASRRRSKLTKLSNYFSLFTPKGYRQMDIVARQPCGHQHDTGQIS